MWEIKFDESFYNALYISYLDSQLYHLSFDRSVSSITEYFLTVNICKELQSWNSKNHYRYKIEPEKPTYLLYRSCFNNSRKETEANIFSPTIFASSSEGFAENLDKIRKGRVDIALSTADGDYKASSEYIIEVKGINPSFSSIQKDFIRIKHYLLATVIGFENNLKAGYIVFVIHINKNKVHNLKDLQGLRDNFLERLKIYLQRFTEDSIVYDIRHKIIDQQSLENLKNDIIDDYGEIVDRTFSAFSVIIELQRLSM